MCNFDNYLSQNHYSKLILLQGRRQFIRFNLWITSFDKDGS